MTTALSNWIEHDNTAWGSCGGRFRYSAALFDQCRSVINTPGSICPAAGTHHTSALSHSKARPKGVMDEVNGLL